MNKKNNKEIISDGIDASAGILSLFNPIFAAVPLITFAVKRVCGLMSPDDIVKRIKKIEKKLEDNKVSVDEFKRQVSKLCDHDRYVVSNNLNKILIDSIPEIVDVYISLFIEMIMNENQRTQYEELCEIISQLNANDINTLSMIKDYIQNGSREFYELNKIEHEKQRLKNIEIKKNNKLIEKENKQIDLMNTNNNLRKIKKLTIEPFQDRNIDIGTKTIFWKDFMKTYEVNIPEMGLALLYEGTDKNNQPTIFWAYVIRSIIKLESLGLISLDNIATLGTTNSLNIDRFHISVFGELLLKYIKG